ncbi:3-oxoacyl-ACP reductase [Paramagnetospirillum kuznetsovii]|uniref:3-oxoacyl-ACP reductase n=1 Tax=Paramagnetospirillum kuznetsovii TaxID=2053833 RepID=A0A364NVG0_9PROT|nr:SDR family oxidoreductase [Paramagnetospirillum kuznetsovii]RAU21043.1 3-oxoacyl-ACP reductase [Paramagnetospirillum kuznetsovii]
MDLGIKGRSAIVCGASRGLGRACAESLAREGVQVLMAARRPDVLEKAAEEIRARTGAVIRTAAVDVTTPQGRAMLLSMLPDPDILVTNAGGPPPGDFRDWDRDAWIRALDANMLTPIELIKATVDQMISRKFGRIVNITSGAVKAPIDVLGLSNGARAGLTGFVAGLARKTVRHNVTINNLLPGPFDTDRIAAVLGGQAKAEGITLEQAKARRIADNPAGRFGDPSEFGDACAWICSAQAGYMTGQNILLDGGAFPGVL